MVKWMLSPPMLTGVVVKYTLSEASLDLVHEGMSSRNVAVWLVLVKVACRAAFRRLCWRCRCCKHCLIPYSLKTRLSPMSEYMAKSPYHG